MAWLHAGIEQPEPPRSKGGPGKRKPVERETRAERLRRAGEQPAMPPLQHAGRLLQWLQDLGFCSHHANGPMPIGWADLAHWARLAGVWLQPWQAQALRSASGAYASQLMEATRPDCPPPWQQAPAEDQRARVARQVRAVLSSNPRPAPA